MKFRNDSRIGQKFGILTIINREYGHKKARYTCLCDCGNIKSIRKDHLISGKIVSCGCISNKLTSEKKKGQVSKLLRPDNYSAKRQLYQRYRTTAREKNLEFNIELNDFIEIAQKNCDYCGKESDKICKVTESSSQIKYTGVDRKDSFKGYFIDNLTPCCTQCNMIKNNLLTYHEMKAAMKIVMEMRKK